MTLIILKVINGHIIGKSKFVLFMTLIFIFLSLYSSYMKSKKNKSGYVGGTITGFISGGLSK